MEYRDYYATLGVPRTASQAEIKKAFRKLARQHHPDVNKGDAAAERRFKEVSEAHEVLSDPEKRRLYDQLGADWESYQRAGATAGAAGGARGPFGGTGGYAGFGGGPGGQAFPGGVRFEFHGDPEDLEGFSDFFRTFFAGGMGATPGARAAGSGSTSGRSTGPGSRPRTGSLEDLLSGFGTDVDLDGVGGRVGGNGGATGRRSVSRQPDAEAEVEISLEEAFHGTQRRVEVGGRRLDVTIPPGVDTGRRIRLSGKAGTGSDAGDLYLRIGVQPHRRFTRSGPDLRRELPITLEEALLGAEVPVETLTGRVLLRIPPGTQNGRTFRLTGQGMPHFRKEGRGDLLVAIKVVLPNALDDEGRRLAQSLFDHIRQPDPRADA